MVTDCKDCKAAEGKEHYGVYSMKCFECRERFLLAEPCKLMREIMAKSMERWGEVPEWKVEPSCGCKFACKRRQYMKTTTQLSNYAH